MLGRDTSALTLYALDVGGCDLTCQQRVFRIIFEVTAAERVAVEVHARTEDHVTAIFLGLVADGLTHLTHEFGIPGRSQTGADRECRSIVGFVGTLAGRVDTYTSRTVGEDGGRDAETRDGRRGTRGTCHKVGLAAYDGTCTKEVVSTANEKFGFLFKGHGL